VSDDVSSYESDQFHYDFKIGKLTLKRRDDERSLDTEEAATSLLCSTIEWYNKYRKNVKKIDIEIDQ
jgi:hypothetical protein